MAFTRPTQAISAAEQNVGLGFLSSRSPEDSKPHTEGFLRGLRSFGYIDGRTAKVEYRWAS